VRWLWIFLLLCGVLWPLPARADPLDDAGRPDLSAAAEVNALEENLNMSGVQSYVNELDKQIKSAVPGLSFKDLLFKMTRGEAAWKAADVFHYLAVYLFKEVVANASLLGRLVVLAVICIVLQNLSVAFEHGSTGQLSRTVTFLMLVTIAVGSFSLAVNTGREVVDKMVGFMQALLPVLLTLLVALGGAASAAVFHPVLLTGLTIMGSLIKNVVLPLVFFSALLGLVSNLSPRFKVSNLAGLLKTAAMGLLGVFGTVFLGLLALQGVAGAVGDGVLLRTAKFSLDAFVPVVGGMFSDALEAVISTALLIKNAAGIAGVVVISVLMALPMLKLISLALIYKLAGALVQPVGDSPVVDCLNDLGNNVIIVFAVVATVGLLFYFTIAIVVAMGNLTVMLR